MNYTTLAPRFTRENAAEMARRATAAREERRAREKAILREYAKNPPVDADEHARNKRVMKQIARCDSFLLTCDAKDFPKLATAKVQLWNLVFPKAGVFRPKPKPNGRSFLSSDSVVEDTPMPSQPSGQSPVAPGALPPKP